jgi:ABC-type transport system substrate-binding protein
VQEKLKKLLIISLIVFVSTIGIVFESFGQPQPQYGGILRRINATGARVIGYYPEMGPQDSTEAFPAVECLMELTKERKMEPFLAESVDIDPSKKMMTFHLRKGALNSTMGRTSMPRSVRGTSS